MALQSRIDIHINLAKAIKDLESDKVLKVGWPEAIRYPEEQGGNFVAQVAAQNEYGAPHKNIPARPFMGPAVSNNRTAWMKLISQGVKKVLKGEMGILEVLDDLGDVAAGDVAKAIKAVTSPPLAPITIMNRFRRLTSKSARKKGVTPSLTKPLIDTGIMLRSVTHAVEKE